MALTQARPSGAFTGRRYGSFAGRDGQHPVDRLTQARAFGAHSGGQYGSFAGRGEFDHPVERITQAHGFGAHTGRRYGSFAGRSASAHPVGRITQARSFAAHSGRRYGSFAGRVESEVTPIPPPDQVGGIPQQPLRFRIRPRQRDDNDVLAITLTILNLVNNQ